MCTTTRRAAVVTRAVPMDTPMTIMRTTCRTSRNWPTWRHDRTDSTRHRRTQVSNTTSCTNHHLMCCRRPGEFLSFLHRAQITANFKWQRHGSWLSIRLVNGRNVFVIRNFENVFVTPAEGRRLISRRIQERARSGEDDWVERKKKVDTDKASPARLSYDAASCVRNETWRCVYLSGWEFWISISGSESRLGLRSVTLSRSAFDTLNEPPWAMHPMGKQIFYASYCGCQVKQIKFLSSARMTWKLRK